ncbi:branched-chain amino acid aminotransferase II [Clavulina sp. PMI_390]|nr:branched-chain amino acid aminotransferase II [Clavulina sp. PMI_390]
MASSLRAGTRFPLRSTRVAGSLRLFSSATSRLNKRPPAGSQLDPMTGELTALPNIDERNVVIERSKSPKTPPLAKNLSFGKTFTDHMLSVEWSALTGWGTPRIHPYGPLGLEPSATVFHYAQTLFEGLKAYRDENGKVTLFRPDMNMKRMNKSAERIALPTFNGDAVVELMKKLVAMDAHWIPQEPGHSLYIRPTLIGTQTALGVGPSSTALLFVICCPVGPYYKGGFKPVKLLATTEFVRAFPGGTGGYKLGANYGPSVVPQVKAAKEGYDQILWLSGEDDELTEVGTMNLFICLKGENDTIELLTPPLGDVILPGITRDSVISIAKEHISGKKKIPGLPDNLVFSERKINMGELVKAGKEGRLLEVFGSGTAAVVCPVDQIGYRGETIHIPTGEAGLPPITKGLLNEIWGRQLGTIESDWSVVVPPVSAA